MLYNGKKVWTEETFDCTKIQIGDYVDQHLVNDFMSCVPPVCFSSTCSQVGEAYGMKYDDKQEQWRNTYATFKRVADENAAIWKYCGHCFLGENEERGIAPQIVSGDYGDYI